MRARKHPDPTLLYSALEEITRESEPRTQIAELELQRLGGHMCKKIGGASRTSGEH